ncbi:MAG: hypothetical protein Q8R42_08500 [Desulfocapsaceae bacterium]|nr:hypothetical protein [Desulfocapsaceae bacterium]
MPQGQDGQAAPEQERAVVVQSAAVFERVVVRSAAAFERAAAQSAALVQAVVVPLSRHRGQYSVGP